MQGSLTEGDDMDTFTACGCTDQLGGTLDNNAPILRFLKGKVNQTTTVSTRIKQTKVLAPNLVSISLSLITMAGQSGQRRNQISIVNFIASTSRCCSTRP